MSKRKQERENEQTLKAAKSRSKGTDPEKVAKLREEAKQVRGRGRLGNVKDASLVGWCEAFPPSF